MDNMLFPNRKNLQKTLSIIIENGAHDVSGQIVAFISRLNEKVKELLIEQGLNINKDGTVNIAGVEKIDITEKYEDNTGSVRTYVNCGKDSDGHPNIIIVEEICSGRFDPYITTLMLRESEEDLDACWADPLATSYTKFSSGSGDNKEVYKFRMNEPLDAPSEPTVILETFEEKEDNYKELIHRSEITKSFFDNFDKGWQEYEADGVETLIRLKDVAAEANEENVDVPDDVQ